MLRIFHESVGRSKTLHAEKNAFPLARGHGSHKRSTDTLGGSSFAYSGDAGSDAWVSEGDLIFEWALARCVRL